MVTLLLNNRPFPDSLLGNLVYLPVVLVNNREKPAEHWVLSNGSGIVISSNDPIISFALLTAVPHTLHVYARNEHGITEEGLVSFNVVLQGSGTIRAGVNWSQPTYQVGDKLEGTVYLADPEGFPPIDLAWTIYRNSVPVYSGKGSKLSFAAAIDGVYTVKISAYDIRRTLIQAESTIFVTQNYALQATPPPPSLDGSLVLLGTLYSNAMSGPAGAATALPYALASYTQDFNLLPGTTHLVFQVDGTVDDDVVVRTKIGNFALVGYPNGLYNSRLGYDYKASTPVPAPADLKTRLTFDAYNAHGSTYSAFNFRVKILCYAATDRIYRYEPCAYSIHPGGAGLRQRRLAFIFTEVDALVDVDSQRDRYQTHSNLISYSTPEATSLPGQSLLNDGSPDTVNPDSGMFFTEANRYAIYEADDADELDAKAVCAIEDVRPFYFTLQMPAQPPVVQVIKRLKGRMVLYLANGCLLAGTVLQAYVATGTGEVLFTFNITEDVYNNTTDTFVRVMSQPVDLSDFQFGISGVVVRCTIDESGVSYTGTTPDVLPVWSEGTIYSKTYSPGVSFDGACFVNPVLVETLDANSGAIAEPIVGCHDPDCGPQGVYCYTETCSPYTAIITVVQPLYHPAPFVASPANQYLCYGTPVFKNAGSLYVEGGGTVAANTKIFAYADSSLCGLVSVYGMCNTGDLLGVVYPCATVPHDYVKYSDSCYAFQYTATTFNVELPGLNFINFNNWMTQGGTFDLIGSTPVYELFDLVPGNGMYTDLLGSPTTNFGTLVSKQAWELTAGDYAIDIIFAGNQRTDPNPTPFSIGVTVGSYGTAWYENGKEMPFETRQLAFTVAGSEYATVNVFQNTASLWGGVYNAGNLLKSVHLYRTAPTADDLLIENFEYTPIPPLPDTVVSVSDVTVVADCQDVACTGSNFLGDAMLYTLSETGSLARVAFDGLDMGIPHFGVAVKATSTGLNGLAAGSLAFVISKSRQTIIRQVAGTGVLAFGLTLTGTDKTFIRKRGGTETRYFLPAGRGSVTIDVVPGDTIYLDFGRVGVRTFKRPCVVVWQPRVAPLREYDTAVLNESGSIKALGFCGLTNRSDYTVFSTLPVDAQTDDVVNPDALVTVSGSDGIQYALVRNAAYNEAKPPLPFNWYAGQTLNGSMTFHFYASRKTYGAHGEMDVWTTTDGTFPEFFRISEFFGLSGSNAVRVDSQDGDIRRNGLQVVASLDGIERPGQYRASDGELRTFDSQSGTVSTDKIFSLVGIDEGISFKIYESPPPPPPFSIFLDAFRVSLDDGATYIPKPLSGGFITFGSAPPLFNYSFNGIKVPTYPLMQITYTVTPLSLGDYVLEWTGLNMSGMLGADLIPQLNAIGLSGVGASVRFTSWVDPGNQPFAKTLLVGDIIRTSTGNSNVLSSVLVPAHYPYSITYRIRIHATSMFPYSGGIFFLPH